MGVPKILPTGVQHNLNSLMSTVKMGQIGLPNIQREFIWKHINVPSVFSCELACLQERARLRYDAIVR
jgi:hypothetical protein